MTNAFDIRTAHKIVARELTARDWPFYRELRLRALKEEGHLFGPHYDTEIRMSNEEWENYCTAKPNHRLFGLFDSKELIGALYSTQWDQDKTGKTALWGSAYIVPEYRGKGMGKPLYQAREKWTSEHPTFKRVLFYIIDGNKRSMEIHEKNGAHHITSKTMIWPHKPPTLWHWYEKQLTTTSENKPSVA